MRVSLSRSAHRSKSLVLPTLDSVADENLFLAAGGRSVRFVLARGRGRRIRESEPFSHVEQILHNLRPFGAVMRRLRVPQAEKSTDQSGAFKLTQALFLCCHSLLLTESREQPRRPLRPGARRTIGTCNHVVVVATIPSIDFLKNLVKLRVLFMRSTSRSDLDPNEFRRFAMPCCLRH